MTIGEPRGTEIRLGHGPKHRIVPALQHKATFLCLPLLMLLVMPIASGGSHWYRPSLGWILGVAFGHTLTRPVRLAQGFTFVRCYGCLGLLPTWPHGARVWRLTCVQLPLAHGCYQLAPRRTFTSNPVPMSATPPGYGLRPWRHPPWHRSLCRAWA